MLDLGSLLGIVAISVSLLVGAGLCWFTIDARRRCEIAERSAADSRQLVEPLMKFSAEQLIQLKTQVEAKIVVHEAKIESGLAQITDITHRFNNIVKRTEQAGRRSKVGDDDWDGTRAGAIAYAEKHGKLPVGFDENEEEAA